MFAPKYEAFNNLLRNKKNEIFHIWLSHHRIWRSTFISVRSTEKVSDKSRGLNELTNHSRELKNDSFQFTIMIGQFAFCLKRSDIHRARNACYRFSALTMNSGLRPPAYVSRVRYVLFVVCTSVVRIKVERVASRGVGVAGGGGCARRAYTRSSNSSFVRRARTSRWLMVTRSAFCAARRIISWDAISRGPKYCCLSVGI